MRWMNKEKNHDSGVATSLSLMQCNFVSHRIDVTSHLNHKLEYNHRICHLFLWYYVRDQRPRISNTSFARVMLWLYVTFLHVTPNDPCREDILDAWRGHKWICCQTSTVKLWTISYERHPRIRMNTIITPQQQTKQTQLTRRSTSSTRTLSYLFRPNDFGLLCT